MSIYLLFMVSLLLNRYINGHVGNSAVCFLTYRPASETIEFAQELAEDTLKYNVDVFIMIDDNTFNTSNISVSANLQLLQISNEQCIYYGYRNTISLAMKWREITSWDKALLYFTQLNDNYAFVWLVENDVFIPSTRAFRSIHQLYSNATDLVVARNEINLLGDTSKWLWSKAIGKLVPPWSCSMANVVGLSRSLLMAIDDHVHWLGEVPFHEFFFNTLAMHLNMTIVSPTELSTIVYQATYSVEQVLRQPNNFWHPFKNLAKQKLWRQILANQSLEENNTIELVDIETICHRNESMANIEQRLTNLLIKFDINKSQLSSTNRFSLRQSFCHVAELCQKRNMSKNIISLVMKLADHAVKLPELQTERSIKKKSLDHLRLEKALKDNKKTIFRSLSNSSNMIQLRKETNNLMNELRQEIQREFQEAQKLQNRTELLSSSSSLLSFAFFITTPRIRFNLSHLVLANNRPTPLAMNKSFFLSKEKIGNQLFDPMNGTANTLFFLLFSSSTLVILFQWKKVRRRISFMAICV